ncbi:insulin-like growth factor-binding protein-related protein 1 [Parasteatoda tepidariorum]|uniref:insulin-like growth factor-binding protein-related protein 1 n=1 Tax=Parasteatoda tepidariorum TaxID=114398 RepID=UPI001C726CEE|nr:insulin-like growth factor-binding protein-related protein 1 [Parasteatoda tepidariorum]
MYFRNYWLFLVYLLFSTASAEDNGCQECVSSSCDPPRNCKAGLVKDACDCCYHCGVKEGDRCDHRDLPSEGAGRCGDNLECQVRNDLSWDDPPEAVCVCKQHIPICGSDGITYENICQFTEARYSKRNGLRAIASEPCIKTPRIRTPLQNILNVTGSSVVLTCEANGWPIPDIHWILQQNGRRIQFPGNRTDTSIQSRNGPNADETTSWLLFRSLSEDNAGTYICKAQNYIGTDSSSATVNVLV